MKIFNGIIFIWDGTNASIPSGWSRVTDLDGYFPKGSSSTTNVAGGNATHTHTSSAHTHTAADHTHTITIGAGSGGAITSASTGIGARYAHTHATFASGSIANTSISSPAATYGAASNDPEHCHVIYVTPTTFVTSLPAGMICLTDSAPPSGFNVCDGNNGTPNLADKFLKGAPTGANADTVTLRGSKQNTHTLSHVHTTSHTHNAATSPSSVGASGQNSGAADVTTHTHSIALPAVTPSTVDNISLVTTETNIEPAYVKLLAMKSSVVTSPQYKTIALWIGDITKIPRGWIICNGNNNTVDTRNKQIKITATLAHVGNSGGSNTHTHASQTHSHTLAHSHSTSISHTNSGNADGSGNQATTAATTHAITSTSVNLTLNSSATTAASSNNEPLYKTAVFIKLVSMSSGNTFLLNFIH